jgi:hypothetical protein
MFANARNLIAKPTNARNSWDFMEPMGFAWNVIQNDSALYAFGLHPARAELRRRKCILNRMRTV